MRKEEKPQRALQNPLWSSEMEQSYSEGYLQRPCRAVPWIPPISAHLLISSFSYVGVQVRQDIVQSHLPASYHRFLRRGLRVKSPRAGCSHIDLAKEDRDGGFEKAAEPMGVEKEPKSPASSAGYPGRTRQSRQVNAGIQA